ncbi:MAG: hypothetical protein Q7R87_03610 [Nanoarchaeota archaeon]|nr:hypothetical protein [Nanoarchaeota archaeon]
MYYKDFQDYLAGEKARLDARWEIDFPDRGVILKVLAHHSQRTKENDAKNYSVTSEYDNIRIDGLGIAGDRHYGFSRKSTGREKEYPRGSEIAGGRHIFAVSPYDCKILSDKIGVEITPELLGANLVIGREDEKDLPLSELPVGTRLFIGESNASEFPKPPIATLVNYVKQMGCVVTGNAIAEYYGRKELSRAFIEHSKNNRGIVCNVEYPVLERATLEAGQKVLFRFHTGITV